MLQADTDHMYQTWIKALQQGIGSAIQSNINTLNRSDDGSTQFSSSNSTSESKQGQQKPRYNFKLFLIKFKIIFSNESTI